MADVIVTSPAEYYPNPDISKPLFNGSMFIGEPDLDPEIVANQIQVKALQENGSTVNISQPIIISSGGVPVDENGDVYIRLIVEQNYSQKVLDKNGSQKYFIPNAFQGTPVTQDETAVRPQPNGYTEDILSDTLAPDAYESDYYDSSESMGSGARWVKTGNTGAAGTTDFDNGLLYDASGNEYKFTSTTYPMLSQFGFGTSKSAAENKDIFQSIIVFSKNSALIVPPASVELEGPVRADSTVGFASNETIHIIGWGDTGLNGVGTNLSRLIFTTDTSGIIFADTAGFKGSISNVSIENKGNTYQGGGVVSFGNPNSAGIVLTDCFQTRINNVVIERFGTGLLVQNENAFSEGTFALNVWCKWNNIGMCFRRNNDTTATDSFSHTQLLGFKIQIPQDQASSDWGTGIRVEGFNTSAANIYNGYMQGNMWTNDTTGTPANLAKYFDLRVRGRVSYSDVSVAFERYGEINIEIDSFFDESRTDFYSIDSSQISITDNNTNISNKFRTRDRGNVVFNANGYNTADWDGRGITVDQVQGIARTDGGSSGFHYGVGTNIDALILQMKAGGGNGVFFQRLSNTTGEAGALNICKITDSGQIVPGFGDGTTEVDNNSPYIIAVSGVPTVGAPNGSLAMRIDGAPGSTFYVRRGGAWFAAA